MKSLRLFSLLILTVPVHAGTITAKYVNFSDCYMSATFVHNGGVVQVATCVPPDQSVTCTYTSDGTANYNWLCQPCSDPACNFPNGAGFSTPSVGNSNNVVESWTCTNAVIAPACECVASLVILPNPYVGGTNARPNNFQTSPICTTNQVVVHYATPSSGPLPDANAPIGGVLTVRDGETVGIRWPLCCTTGWTIGYTGMVTCITNGVVASQLPVTLSVPNWQGFLPCPQNGTPSDPSPQNYLLPPYDTAFIPGGLHGLNRPTGTGYNGCIWLAHMQCFSASPPHCAFYFEEIKLMMCNDAVNVVNWIPPLPSGYHPDITDLLTGDINNIYNSPAPTAVQPITNASSAISTIDPWFWYDWGTWGHLMGHH